MAAYQRVSRGYMGRVLGFPGVISEGKTLDECRASLADALHEMACAYHQQGEAVPSEQLIFEPLVIELPAVR